MSIWSLKGSVVELVILLSVGERAKLTRLKPVFEGDNEARELLK